MRRRYACDACSTLNEGDPAGSGVLLFVRGDRVEREEKPLCERCALAVSLAALHRFVEEEEEG